jgi:hypothetical protein
MVCYSDSWSDILSWVVGFAMVYLVIIPSCICWILYDRRRFILAQDAPQWLQPLVGPYRRECYFWEMFLVFRKTVFFPGSKSFVDMDNISWYFLHCIDCAAYFHNLGYVCSPICYEWNQLHQHSVSLFGSSILYDSQSFKPLDIFIHAIAFKSTYLVSRKRQRDSLLLF